MKKIIMLCLMLIITACGGPVKRVFPPQVSLQEVVLNANGEASAKFRIQNYSTVTTRFSRIVSNLRIAGNEGARLDFNPDVSIGPGSIEVVSQTFTLSAEAKASIETALKNRTRISYSLGGDISSSEPRSSFEIKYESALNPVPGLPNTLR
jgi:hypothetical protein